MERIEVKLKTSRDALLGYIRKKVGDADLAEDILHDSLLKALRSSSEVRDDEKFISWLYQIVNNAIIDMYRHRDVERRYREAHAATDEPRVEPDDMAQLCACIMELIPSLKPEYAGLIQELDLGQGDPEDVAGRLGITRNNLKVRHHRARTQLRERLEETCGSCAEHGCLDCGCRRSVS